MGTPFEISDQYVDSLAELDPLFATSLGRTDSRWPDLSPAGLATRRDRTTQFFQRFAEHLDHPEPRQRLAARVLAQSIQEYLDALDNGDQYDDLRHMASTFQRLRSVFDLMATNTDDDWEAIRTRLSTIDAAYHGYVATLTEGIQMGRTVAMRQVLSVIDQAEGLAGEVSSFYAITEKARGTGHETAIADAVEHARRAVHAFGEFLRNEYLVHASHEDGVGEDRYRRAADRFVGMSVDPHEAYAWGWEELERLLAEMHDVGEQIRPGATFAEVTDLLETDPERAAHSPQDFVQFIAERQQRALDELAGTHFDVPSEIREVTVQIAPPGGPLGAYYTGPSEDFSRPGGIWYSTGDQTVFPLYHQVSTAYHEGFPGHHLQVGTAATSIEQISRGQRRTIWYPGYGEGWALYAERLMGELGYLESPDYVFGMLSKHMYRAVRVVVDIGLHLGLEIPSTAPLHAGQPWTFDTAVEYLQVYGFRTPAQAPNEVLRYLGWPGQAISYKLGERAILALRDDALEAGIELKEFHRRMLTSGAMRLDMLRGIVLESQ
ncbi:MAG: DUF885 domain-containing protein [Acidimicrobiia bacterium]|nr:DUF885 domain-containing protein [Acidimicrobiia bacterium]